MKRLNSKALASLEPAETIVMTCHRHKALIKPSEKTGLPYSHRRPANQKQYVIAQMRFTISGPQPMRLVGAL